MDNVIKPAPRNDASPSAAGDVPGAPKLDPPVPAPQGVTAPLDAKRVVVHTMRDDLTAAKAAPLGPSIPPSTPISRSGTLDLPSQRDGQRANTFSAPQPPGRTFPLPPKKTAEPSAVKVPAGSRGRRWKMIGIIGGAVILLVAIGGSLWWFTNQLSQSGSVPGTERVVPAGDVIPASAALVMRYQLQSPEQRASLRRLWTGGSSTLVSPNRRVASFTIPSAASPLPAATGTAPVGTGLVEQNAPSSLTSPIPREVVPPAVSEAPATVMGLVSGNPQLLLQDESVSEFFYIILPNEPRLYLLVPRTESTDRLFAEESAWQMVRRDNWLIVHPRDVAGYEAALAAGSRSSRGGLPDLPAPFSIQLLLDDPLLSQQGLGFLRATAAEPAATTVLHAQAAGEALLFTNSSRLDVASSPAPGPPVVLLDLVPDDAISALINQSLAEDLANGQSGLDSSVIGQPAVKQLLSELTGPYVFYRRKGVDALEDIGLIINLPKSLAATLKAGDATLETALASLLPLFMDKTPVRQLAFADASYAGNPLRYANIIGDTRALDYAVRDEQLLVASSKEGMFALLDTVAGSAQPLSASPAWSEIIQQRNVVISGQSAYLTQLQHPLLAALLPSTNGLIRLGISTQLVENETIINGAVIK